VLPNEDASQLITCCNDHSAAVLKTASGEKEMDFRGHENVVEIAIFAPSRVYPAFRQLGGLPASTSKEKEPAGLFAATASRDKSIKLWDSKTGSCIKTLVGHDNWVHSLIFHPSSPYLLSASDDGTIRVWDLTSGRNIKTIEAHGLFVTCLAWGRSEMGGTTQDGASGAKPESGGGSRKVNVVASGSADCSIKIWAP